LGESIVTLPVKNPTNRSSAESGSVERHAMTESPITPRLKLIPQLSVFGCERPVIGLFVHRFHERGYRTIAESGVDHAAMVRM
jgi:hypothetical protein